MKLTRADLADLTYFLAIARHRTLSAAARALGVQQTTMGRRLAGLEARAGARLAGPAVTPGIAVSTQTWRTKKPQIAVIVTGVAWMFGHLDMRRAGTVVIGIIVIFSAATIVDLITGGGS